MKKFYLHISLIFLTSVAYTQSFTNYTKLSTSGKLPDNFITSIVIDNKENIWFGTDKGITKFDGINWTTYTIEDGLIGNYIHSMAMDGKGNLWIGAEDPDTEYGGVSKFDGSGWVNYSKKDGLISYYIDAIATDSTDNIYVCSSSVWFDLGFLAWNGGVTKFDGSKWTTITKKYRYAFRALAIDGQNNLWIGNDFVSNILDPDESIPPYYSSVQKINYSDTIVYTKNDGLPGTHVFSVVIDPNEKKWVATDSGVAMYDGINWNVYTTKDGLTDNYVFSIAIDDYGNKWFGTFAGVTKFDGTNWTTYTTQDGLIDNHVTEIAIDSEGNKWFGTYGGVSKLVDQNMTSICKLTAEDVNIYLQPSTNKLYISFSTSLQTNIAIYNLNGVSLYTSTIHSDKTEIDINGFLPGAYLVKINIAGKGTITRKIVKM